MMVGAQVAIMDFELETYIQNKGMAKSGDHELWTAQRQFETNLIISDMYAYFCIGNIQTDTYIDSSYLYVIKVLCLFIYCFFIHLYFLIYILLPKNMYHCVVVTRWGGQTISSQEC